MICDGAPMGVNGNEAEKSCSWFDTAEDSSPTPLAAKIWSDVTLTDVPSDVEGCAGDCDDEMTEGGLFEPGRDSGVCACSGGDWRPSRCAYVSMMFIKHSGMGKSSYALHSDTVSGEAKKKEYIGGIKQTKQAEE
jgi:hypothetical protein